MADVMPVIQHTVDCLQTIGVCNQSTVPLSANDRMFVFNQPDVLKKHLDLFCKLPKGARAYSHWSVDRYSRRRLGLLLISLNLYY